MHRLDELGRLGVDLDLLAKLGDVLVKRAALKWRLFPPTLPVESPTPEHNPNTRSKCFEESHLTQTELQDSGAIDSLKLGRGHRIWAKTKVTQMV